MVIMFDVHEDDHLDHGDEWPTLILLIMALVIKIILIMVMAFPDYDGVGLCFWTFRSFPV